MLKKCQIIISLHRSPPSPHYQLVRSKIPTKKNNTVYGPVATTIGSLSNHDDDGNKFAYLAMKNSIFARFARAFFIFWHFDDVLVLSMTSNDLFCSCVDDVSIWWQMFNSVLLCPKRWFQFNSRIVRTNFSSIMTLNDWNMIAETRSYIFRWRFRFRWRRVYKLPNILRDSLNVRAARRNNSWWRIDRWCDGETSCYRYNITGLPNITNLRE